MKTEQIKNTAQDIKDWLIKQAVADKLPTDLNQLSTKAIEKIIAKAIEKAKPTQLEQAIVKASEFLCDGDLTVEEQLKAIAKHKDEYDMLDNVEGVIVWEKVENEWKVIDFMEYINYPYPNVF